jgi:hypothetical protein
MQYALLAPFPELAGVVEPWLERTATQKPSSGIPAHVTLLYPCPEEIAVIGDVVAAVPAFDVEFGELRRFPGTLWLAPDPVQPFVDLTEALVERFPEWLPYGGEFAEIVPHLTVAQGAGVTLDTAEEAVASRLPLRGRVREAVLFGEVEPGRWAPQVAFPFEGA